MAQPKYIPAAFEQKWAEQWEKDQIYKTPDPKSAEKKAYVLDMFPYPSGAGLHVGHVEGYTATDIYSRYLRMNGYAVLHPMGWDAFGLPAENYAIKTNVHPEITTNNAIKTFIAQIKRTGLSYDWSRELGTHRADYYKWTQWLFLLLYKKGLAYRKEALVNWDPVDQTVLANEQVLPDGTAERSGAKVEQRMLTQWFFKITDYAERLLQDLDKLDWPESTKQGQRNWIGKSTGINITYQVDGMDAPITVFTTRPDTNFGATFIVLAPESEYVRSHIESFPKKDEVKIYLEQAKLRTELERISNKSKTGVFTGLYAINNLNGKKLPVYVGDFVLATVGTGALVGVPGHDMRDFEFAQAMGLPVIRVVIGPDGDTGPITTAEQVQEGEGTMVNSEFLDGMDTIAAKEKIMDYLEEKGWGKRVTNYRLRDWLISRQRFWGAPIPIVYDKDGKDHPVDQAELPVILPMDVEFKPTGVSPLKDHAGFQAVDTTKYGEGAYREADTMDTFVDSSWYFLRFCDPHNETEFASREAMNKWGPVDLYVGGAEHTVLHLLYARFFTKVLFDEGYITFDEPFLKLRHQGTILGPDNRKMSKRYGNVINPLEVADQFGADTLRMYEMFMGPFSDMKAWNTQNIQGIYRFLTRIWNVFHTEASFATAATGRDADPAVVSRLQKTIAKVGSDILEMKFNTAISSMMEFMNAWEGKAISREDAQKFLLILAPFAPFITEELWHTVMGQTTSIHTQRWPEVDTSKILAETIELPVQVNGKVRSKITIESADVPEEEIRKLVMADPRVLQFTGGKVAKFIYVPGRIVNIIAK
ncbi:MAG: leucine--tRNA ligase [Patescibacteria group bacterium]|nr:leucine--tRNA ligase [Patescibacteria group bacterium]